MKRTGFLFTAILAMMLALGACSSDDEGTGNGGTNGGGTTGGDAIDDTGSTTVDDTGSSTSDDTGGSTGDDTGVATGDGGTGSGGDGGTGSGEDGGTTGMDVADGGTGGMDTSRGGGDADTSKPDFVTRTGASNCPTAAAARVQVGPGNTYQTTIGQSDSSGPGGNATIQKGEWVNFSWTGGTHTVTGDKSDNFGSNLNDACKTDNTAWFDSGSRTSGIWCVQFNKTGKFWYQCTVGGHCEGGMWSFINVEDN